MEKEIETSPESTESEKSAQSSNIWEWYEAAVSAIVILILIASFFFRVVQVDGDSMKNTLLDGDRLIVWGAGYEPQRGDVVIVDGNSAYGKPLVKRVIAVGGDTIYIDYENGNVEVNGELLDEPYIRQKTHLYFDVEFPLTVPQGTVFAMGDNRNESLDSRSSRVGCIDNRNILGKVLLRFLPFNRLGAIS